MWIKFAGVLVNASQGTYFVPQENKTSIAFIPYTADLEPVLEHFKTEQELDVRFAELESMLIDDFNYCQKCGEEETLRRDEQGIM